ncbi:MAG: carbonic anhydrase [Myxococcales bacterium]|nr:carbonic anhydrase [Myxococcales bacterium]
MERLVKGIEGFVSTVYESERALFLRLAADQQPDVLIVTCSDSRVDPNLVTQSKPGDLFVLRNAGNIVPPYGAGGDGEAATIEYALSVLGVRHIVVCGHTDCGAIKALLDPESVASLTEVKRWLGYAETTRRIVERIGETDTIKRMRTAIETHVLTQLDNLRTHPAVAAALAASELELHGWVYDIGRGHIDAWCMNQRQFIDVQEAESADSSSDDWRSTR